MTIAEITQTEARYITITVVILLLTAGLLVGIRLIVHQRVRRVRFGVFLERDDPSNHDDDDQAEP